MTENVKRRKWPIVVAVGLLMYVLSVGPAVGLLMRMPRSVAEPLTLAATVLYEPVFYVARATGMQWTVYRYQKLFSVNPEEELPAGVLPPE
jgi:hypothetical protein